jgi:flagellar basal body-associated protein FliL
MKKILIIIIAVVVVVGAAVYFLFLSPPPKPETIFYVPGEYFVTNIADSTRLLKATIVLEISTTEPDAVTLYLTENNHIIRDNIVFTLRSKSEGELRSEGIEETLRTEIVKNLESKMGLDYITTIYFNDYVIQ